MLDNRKERGGDHKSEEFQVSKLPSGNFETLQLEKKSHEKTAEVIGISPRKVSRTRIVLDYANEQTKREVLDGKKLRPSKIVSPAKHFNSTCVSTCPVMSKCLGIDDRIRKELPCQK